MKLILLVVGKTSSPEIKTLCNEYKQRLEHYTKFEELVLDNSAIKTKDERQRKELESDLILRKISNTDFLILLDEKGRELTSVQLAGYIESLSSQSIRNVYFVIGGAYGFSKTLYQRANQKISLSKLTFPHQLIRPLFMEQLYRAFTIIRHESYHHQ
jgi:23S rRNA (pseudouridine1915-N3)-methyltransferase